MNRADLKNSVFMMMAHKLATLSTCHRLQVGCILLRPDGGIASGGYNGALPGMPHCTPETCNCDKRCLHTSHAEESALAFSSGEISTAYVTHEPCLVCTRQLVRRGVKKIFFFHPYHSMSGQEKGERDAILEHYGVEMIGLS